MSPMSLPCCNFLFAFTPRHLRTVSRHNWPALVSSSSNSYNHSTNCNASVRCNCSASRLGEVKDSIGISTCKGESISLPIPVTHILSKRHVGCVVISGLGSIPRRYFHTSPVQFNPRFKLSLVRQHPKEVGGRDDEANEDEEGPSYLKSHAYRQLCTWRSKSELAQVLVDNQIHNEHGLFVTNKPFGVGVRNPAARHRQPGQVESHQIHVRGLDISPYTLEDALPELRLLLNKPDLVLVKSTEKLTSGPAIFADDEPTGKRFSNALVSSKGSFHTFYKFHVITTLPPLIQDPHKVERCGIKLKASYGSEVKQPVIERDYSINSIKRQDIIPVMVQTKPLKPGFNAGYLVEIMTSKTQNNFLRVHCADKLAPLLGDHLYSARVRMLKGVATKIDPGHLIPGTSFQKLSEKMIDLLQLKTPEDSLMVPTHVHLRSFKVKKFLGKNQEMEFEAPYPPYFKWTCEQLGIQVYDELI